MGPTIIICAARYTPHNETFDAMRKNLNTLIILDLRVAFYGVEFK
jgi:hypothetical protein